MTNKEKIYSELIKNAMNQDYAKFSEISKELIFNKVDKILTQSKDDINKLLGKQKKVNYPTL